MKLILVGVIFICETLRAESQASLNYVNETDDLTCDFTTNFCHWSSVSLPPENPNRWKLSNYINTSDGAVITSSLNQFAYAQFNKRSGSATLISDGINCQFEPMQLRFQTYFTNNTKLFICHRILSPKSKFTNCQEIKNEVYNEWETHTISNIYQSKPYQLIFRAFGSNEFNVVALKNFTISNGTLCKNRNPRNSDYQNHIDVITYEDWQKIRKGNEPPPQVHPRILLIVSEQVESSTTAETKTTTENQDTATTTITQLSSITITTTTVAPKTSITRCLNDFCDEKESSEEEASTEPAESKDDVTTETSADKSTKAPATEISLQNAPSLGQWVQLLKNVAPIIPIIPSLINSLKYGETPPISSTATFNQFGPEQLGGEKVFSWKPGETRRAPLTPIVPLTINQLPHKNVFGIATSSVPMEVATTPAEASITTAPAFRQDLNLSALTVNELKTLETIHKKIFPLAPQPMPASHHTRGESRRKAEGRPRVIETHRSRAPEVPTSPPDTTKVTTQAPMVVFEKPRQQLSDMKSSVSKNLKYLTPQMIEELNMVSNLPDLEVLTEGLDLSLLNKPGGFAILKQQFMERLIRRLPFKDDDTDTDLLRAARYRT